MISMNEGWHLQLMDWYYCVPRYRRPHFLGTFFWSKRQEFCLFIKKKRVARFIRKPRAKTRYKASLYGKLAKTAITQRQTPAPRPRTKRADDTSAQARRDDTQNTRAWSRRSDVRTGPETVPAPGRQRNCQAKQRTV